MDTYGVHLSQPLSNPYMGFPPIGQAYMDEGAMLAYKQSEMEKTVRKARGALRGVQEERDALTKVMEPIPTGLVVVLVPVVVVHKFSNGIIPP